MRYPKPLLLLVAVALLAAGCSGSSKGQVENLKVPRLMVESRASQYGGFGAEVVTLPVSGTRIPIASDPLVHEFEIRNAELVKVEMGMALLLQLTAKGSRELYRGTVTNMGGRIVLLVNGAAVGSRRIDEAISDGNYYTFVELPDEDLGQLVIDLKESIAYLQERKKEEF